jgi:heme oxygenase
LGCLYVLEGATLGGRTLLPLVQARLGFTANNGAAFLASYDEDVAPMWRSFGVALDTWCDAAERRDRATRAAVATFTSLHEWLCGTPDGR